jgi:phosphoribosylanthranilate isomerase
MTRVKICGITNVEDAMLAVQFGADALGFNFYERSPRYIDPNDARPIASELPEQIIKVGVFVNASIEKMVDVAQSVGLDFLQLHGDETGEKVELVKRKSRKGIIKAFRVSNGFSSNVVSDFDADAILLDAYSRDAYGGTGSIFDWELARSLSVSRSVYLAGGLDKENVADAIKIVRPFAVDVASGVEVQPGKKDPMKLEAFITNAKKA